MAMISLLVQTPSVPSMVHLWLGSCQVEMMNIYADLDDSDDIDDIDDLDDLDNHDNQDDIIIILSSYYHHDDNTKCAIHGPLMAGIMPC